MKVSFSCLENEMKGWLFGWVVAKCINVCVCWILWIQVGKIGRMEWLIVVKYGLVVRMNENGGRHIECVKFWKFGIVKKGNEKHKVRTSVNLK